MAPELAFAEELRDVLQPLGSARLEYVTAEFQPFTNQQRPDVVFSPRVGGYNGQLIFIEIKLSTKPMRDAKAFQVLLEHKEFASEYLEADIGRYIFIVNSEVPEFSKKFLGDHGIIVLDRVTTSSEVTPKLKEFGILP